MLDTTPRTSYRFFNGVVERKASGAALPDMKRLLWLPLIFAASLWADEAADRAEIGRTVSALNVVPPRAGLFTADSEAPAVLATLGGGGGLTVTISHEPWGEATIGPASGPASNPIISIAKIRFITPDVALVDAAATHAGGKDATPLVFVLKKEGDSWKIASARITQQPLRP